MLSNQTIKKQIMVLYDKLIGLTCVK